MDLATIAGVTLAVFLGELGARVVGQALIDWHNRRTWLRMERHAYESAKRIASELHSAEAEPIPLRRTAVWPPKPRAN